MTYLPIIFVCLVGNQCDFIYAKPVASRAICETMNAESELRLEAVDAVVAYKSACVPVERTTDQGQKFDVRY